MNRSDRSAARAMGELARELGVQRSYRDATGTRRSARPEALAAVLRALGADPGEHGRRAPAALAELRAARAAPAAPPVVVAWDGSCQVELPGGRAAEWTLALEDGGERTGRAASGRIGLRGLPAGYHDLHIGAGRGAGSTRVIAAPSRAHEPQPGGWGVFLPLYALPGRFGVGDLAGLGRLVAWTGDRGGDLVGSTPLNAAFLDTPFDPSPYAPVSRLFWNELHVAPELAPELAGSAEARRLLEAPELAALRCGRMVDHRASMAAKRRVLEALLDAVTPARADAMRRHLEAHPEIARYAGFRARCEREQRGWRGWSGGLEADAADTPAARYHAYAQWLFAEQLAAATGREARAGLYLDMPLGVHPEGFDTWRFGDAFADGVSAGAPPDGFFTGGQDWGFPPLHPRRICEQRLAYPAAALRALLGHAATVRVDHVMGLHRLFWVPHGMPAADGVYVRYPAQELYAVLALESHRHRTAVVGEDLGTVQREVRREMRRRGLLRSHVLQIEATAPGDPLAEIPRAALASLNTHDMPTFAGFWEGRDTASTDRLRAALRRRGNPARTAAEALDGCLEVLASSPARLMLLNLEDLWLESEPQNTPGTGVEQPNWRRRARHGAAELDRLPEVRRRVDRVAELRREAA